MESFENANKNNKNNNIFEQNNNINEQSNLDNRNEQKREKKSEGDEIYNNQKENKNDMDINNDIKNQKTKNKNTTINNNECCPTIRLKSSEDKIYDVPFFILMKSKLLYSSIHEYLELIKHGEIFRLNEVDNKNLELIIEYLRHYKNKEPKEIPKPFPERVDENFLREILDNDDNDWTYNFITKLKLEEAIHLLNCADYLQIDGLINILTAKIAYEMCNCDIEEAREKFGIQSDMDEEEIEEYEEFVKYPMD